MSRRATLAFRWFVAVAVLLGVALAACSDDSDNGNEADQPEEPETTDESNETAEQPETLVEAYAAMLASDPPLGVGVTREEAACMADVMVDGIGGEAFERAGIAPADVSEELSIGEQLGDEAPSEDQAAAIVDDWADCTDFVLVIASVMVDQYDTTDDEVACVADGLRESDYISTSGFDAGLTNRPTDEEAPPEEADALLGLIDTCIAPETQRAFFVDLFAENFYQPGGDLTQEQAQCAAETLVDLIGPDRIPNASNEEMNIAGETAIRECLGLS